MNTINTSLNLPNINQFSDQQVKPIERIQFNPNVDTSSKTDSNNLSTLEHNNQINNEADSKLLNPKEISDYVEKANKLVLIFDKSIKFIYKPESGKNYIDIIDNNTNEVIKKIPPEAIRRFLETIGNVVGLIIDKKV